MVISNLESECTIKPILHGFNPLLSTVLETQILIGKRRKVFSF